MKQGQTGTLTQNKDFRTLYYHGRSQVHPLLVTYARKNKLGYCRIGITTGKKLGKAVQRNRCRRLIREAYRTLSPAPKGGWDIVFVARGRMVQSSMMKVRGVMGKQLSALSVVAQSGAPRSGGGLSGEKAAH